MRQLFLVSLLVACGGSSDGDNPDAPDIVVPDAPKPACTKPSVFVNTLPAAGETFEPGSDDASTNRTSLLNQIGAPATVTPYQGDTAAVVAAARALLEPHGIVVTDVDPGTVPHYEIVIVGGGWPFPGQFASLAPSRCSPTPNSVAMVNAFAGRTPEDLAVSVAFVLGVMNGLEYSSDFSNCMTLTLGGAACTFSATSPVTQPPRCAGGGTTQDQLAILTASLGCD